MQWDKLIPVLSDHFDPTKSAHAIPPEDIPLIIILDGSSSIATLARLTDHKPEEIHARLQNFEKMGILEWRETKKTVRKYSSTSRSSNSLGEAPKVLGNQRMARRPTPASPNSRMPQTPAPATRTPRPPSKTSGPPMPQAPSRMKGRRPRAQQPPQQTPPPPSQERPTGSAYPTLQQTPAPQSVRKSPDPAGLRQTPSSGRASGPPEGMLQPSSSLQQTPPPASRRTPAPPAGLQTPPPASGPKGPAKSKFRPFRARGSNSTLKRRPTEPKTEASSPAPSPFPSKPNKQAPPREAATPPEPRTAEAPSASQQTSRPSEPVQPTPTQKSSNGFAPMPLTSWELAEQRKEKEQGGTPSAPSTPSSSGVMDLSGFEETAMAPSPAKTSGSFEKFDGFDDEPSKKPALSALQQAANDAAMQMQEPEKPASQQKAPKLETERTPGVTPKPEARLPSEAPSGFEVTPKPEAKLKAKAEDPDSLQEAEEEEWDSVDDWWAMAPEDVGLRSEDYVALIQKRKERQMAMEGNRDEEAEVDDFNPMWREELFDSVS